MDTSTRSHRLTLSLIVVTTLVASLLLVLLGPSAALADHINEATYEFDFVNGTSLTGSHGPGAEAPIPIELLEAFYGSGNVPAALIGVTIHVSCSEAFTDGWANSGFPDEVDHREWRIANYSIVRHTPGNIQECGETFVTTPTDPSTTSTVASTTSTDSSTTSTDPSTTSTVAFFEILPTTIVHSTEPEVTPTNEALPFTGAENGLATAYALVLVVGGLLTLVWAKQLQVGRHESSDG